MTNLVITTDRRTYHLEMRSSASTYMASVSWTYPASDLLALKKQRAEADALLLVLISLIVLLALKPPSPRVGDRQELVNVEYKPITDALSKLPASYDGVQPEKKAEAGKPTPVAPAPLSVPPLKPPLPDPLAEAGYYLSYLFRSSNAIIAKDLSTETRSKRSRSRRAHVGILPGVRRGTASLRRAPRPLRTTARRQRAAPSRRHRVAGVRPRRRRLDPDARPRADRPGRRRRSDGRP